MNAAGVVRALDRQGTTIKLRRLTGTQRIPIEVECRAFIQIGVTRTPGPLVGSVQQVDDVVTLTDREIVAKHWPAPPRHGDEIVYPNDRVTIVQGDAMEYRLDPDRVYVVKTRGG